MRQDNMRDLPLLSVVMSVYNGGNTLKQTIDSILSQKGVKLEFIIINDGSTDATNDVLGECAAKDDRLKIIHQKNKGLTQSLILGCKKANGEYIARQEISRLPRDFKGSAHWPNPLNIVRSFGTISWICFFGA